MQIKVSNTTQDNLAFEKDDTAFLHEEEIIMLHQMNQLNSQNGYRVEQEELKACR
jgi:hypothetical protein